MHLVDLALSSDDELFIVVPRDEGDAKSESLFVGLLYDHYQICLTPDGEPWELGRGAMGITYKATDTHLDSPVALKVITPHRLSSTNARERFLYEARTAAQLRHPNIATIHHLGKDGAVCFYAMEYIEGQTLENQVRRLGPLPVETALSVALSCARALQVAHDRRFIHRDLKPSNIMLVAGALDQDGVAPLVKLIDFGLVKALSDDPSVAEEITQTYFAGTPQYASPEQIRGSEVDVRSDIYSLGACLQFMLTGESTNAVSLKSDGTEFCRSGVFPTRKHPRNVSTFVSILVGSMTATDKTVRPQSISEVVLALQSCQKKLANRGASQQWIVLCSISLCALATLTVLARHANSSAVPASTIVSQNRADVRLLYAKAEEARLKLTKADLTQAVNLYTQAISKAPNDSDLHAGLAIAYFNLVARCNSPNTDLVLAADHAQRALALNPASPKGFHAQAAIKTFQGRPWEALTELHRAIELDSKYVPALRDFALLWSYVGKPQFTYAWAKEAAELEPANFFGWMIAGDVAADLGKDEEAERIYRRVLSINPGYLTAHCGLMHIHLLAGKFAQADQDRALAASIDPESEFLLNLSAQCDFFRGNYSEAEATYRKLLAKNRNGLVSFYGGISYLSALGFLRCRAGDATEGSALLEEAATLHIKDSDGPQAIYDLAAIRSAQGRPASALALLRQAVDSGWTDHRATRLDPRFETIRQRPEFEALLNDLSVRVSIMRREAEQLSANSLKIQDFPIAPR